MLKFFGIPLGVVALCALCATGSASDEKPLWEHTPDTISPEWAEYFKKKG